MGALEFGLGSLEFGLGGLESSCGWICKFQVRVQWRFSCNGGDEILESKKKSVNFLSI